MSSSPNVDGRKIQTDQLSPFSVSIIEQEYNNLLEEFTILKFTPLVKMNIETVKYSGELIVRIFKLARLIKKVPKFD